MNAFLLFGLLCAALATVCWFSIVRHAFGRSVGTGVMVLLIPCFIFYYAFMQFEHRRKGMLVAGFLAGSFLFVALQTAGGGAPLAFLMNQRSGSGIGYPLP